MWDVLKSVWYQWMGRSQKNRQPFEHQRVCDPNKNKPHHSYSLHNNQLRAEFQSPKRAKSKLRSPTLLSGTRVRRWCSTFAAVIGGLGILLKYQAWSNKLDYLRTWTIIGEHSYLYLQNTRLAQHNSQCAIWVIGAHLWERFNCISTASSTSRLMMAESANDFATWD